MIAERPPSWYLTIWLCGSGVTELQMSYCHELQARLMLRGLDSQVVDLTEEVEEAPDGSGFQAACTLVLAGRANPPEAEPDGAPKSKIFRVCFHVNGCDGGIEVLSGREPAEVAVDRTLAVLRAAGVLEVLEENVRRDEELMIRRLYDLGYL